MTYQDSSPSRTLHEWHDYILRDKHREQWEKSNWRTKQWWARQRIRRVASAEPIRAWWSEASRYVDKYASLVYRWTGKSRLKQLQQMAMLAVSYGIPAKEYYNYKFYLEDRIGIANKFLLTEPKKVLNHHIIHLTKEHYPFPPRDKVGWHEWVRENNIPAPKLLMSFENGDNTNHISSQMDLPEKDLFSIRSDLYGGEGSEIWRFRNGYYTNTQPPINHFTSTELVSYLSHKSNEHPIVLQERLYNHSEVPILSLGGLSTCRLVTGRLPERSPSVLFAVMKFPRRDAIVDNVSAGALASPVCVQSGELGAAISDLPSPNGDFFEEHPDTGHRIKGTTVPMWEDMTELALEVHQKLSGIPFIGWDIAICNDGLKIIEPNDGWGGRIIENPSGVPLNETRYGTMYDAWMQHLHQNQ